MVTFARLRTLLREIRNIRAYYALYPKNRESLENELSPKQLDLLEKFNLSVNEMNSISETAAFQYGFALGVQIMMECICERSNSFEE